MSFPLAWKYTGTFQEFRFFFPGTKNCCDVYDSCRQHSSSPFFQLTIPNPCEETSREMLPGGVYSSPLAHSNVCPASPVTLLLRSSKAVPPSPGSPLANRVLTRSLNFSPPHKRVVSPPPSPAAAFQQHRKKPRRGRLSQSRRSALNQSSGESDSAVFTYQTRLKERQERREKRKDQNRAILGRKPTKRNRPAEAVDYGLTFATLIHADKCIINACTVKHCEGEKWTACIDLLSVCVIFQISQIPEYSKIEGDCKLTRRINNMLIYGSV
jgi:hypothetical protein